MKNRLRIVSIILTWCFLLSIVRIMHIMTEPKYADAEASQSYATVEVAKSRGTVYDVNMKPLTNTTFGYRAAVVASPEVVTRLSEILDATGFDEIMSILKKGKPTVVSTKSYFEAEGAYVHEYYDYYSAGTVLSPHMLGYLDSEGHGVCGIEKAFDDLLFPKGALKVSFCLDARGTALAGIDPIVTGEDEYSVTAGVVTTLDKTVQQVVEETAAAMLSKGSVVVLDVGNGEIRASCSVPSFSVTNVGASLGSDNSPLVNRSLAAYNVGSVFKLCTAAAALDCGISASCEYTCKGYVDIGDTRYWCNNKTGHGVLDMDGALRRSCNTYFIKLAMDTGAGNVYTTAKSFGFGSKTELCAGVVGIAGNMPELPELLSNNGALANFAFGQGELLATPLQVASMVAAISCGGLLTQPSLIKGTVNREGDVTAYSTNRTVRVIKKSSAELLKSMMVSVVTEGTGKNAAVEGVTIGGKTATAETGWYVDGAEITQAWFAGFFPAEAPRYAVAVLAEGGSSGAASAAPVLAAIVQRLREKEYI
ncbi:MAG: penicillin-binding protein 2 [Clostridia bacterium]|nr:penicillin-binding protein 2 [Clostridia bacterium]